MPLVGYYTGFKVDISLEDKQQKESLVMNEEFIQHCPDIQQSASIEDTKGQLIKHRRITVLWFESLIWKLSGTWQIISGDDQDCAWRCSHWQCYHQTSTNP